MKDSYLVLLYTHGAYAVFVVGSIALGLNMLFLTPAFMPLSLDKWLVGIVFLLHGVSKLLAFLLRGSSDTWPKVAMASTVAVHMFWFVATTYDFFARSLTSLQLPIFCAIVAAQGFIAFIQPSANPAASPSPLPIPTPVTGMEQ